MLLGIHEETYNTREINARRKMEGKLNGGRPKRNWEKGVEDWMEAIGVFVDNLAIMVRIIRSGRCRSFTLCSSVLKNEE